jgi:hypothetical protein
VATVIFLFTKFTEGAWVVVVAIPAFIFMFTRVHAYYQRASQALGIGQTPARPAAKPTIVVVPVAGVSRLAEQAISEALSISHQVVAVCVVMEDPSAAAGEGDATAGAAGGAAGPGAGSPGEGDTRSPDDGNGGAGAAGTAPLGGQLPRESAPDGPGASPPLVDRARQLETDWIRWGPGVPLRVLRTEYASVVRPIVAFIDDLRRRQEEQIMVLVPVAIPERTRYLFLHNHIDLVLERALRARTDVVIGRVQVPLHEDGGGQNDGEAAGQLASGGPTSSGPGPGFGPRRA